MTLFIVFICILFFNAGTYFIKKNVQKLRKTNRRKLRMRKLVENFEVKLSEQLSSSFQKEIVSVESACVYISLEIFKKIDIIFPYP